MKVAARHQDEGALEIMSREIFPSATAMAPGIGGIFGGRPKVQPVMRLYSFLLDKAQVPVRVHFENSDTEVRVPTTSASSAPMASPDSPPPAIASAATGPMKTVRLVDLAYARSGDKGDASNIAVIARREDYLPFIAAQLTAEAVAAYLAHVAHGPVRRFDWPGLHGFNFFLERALGGGGVSSLRYDPQGKGHAQMLLEFPINVPQAWDVETR